ncbi:cysteine-rich and transmembrane domain-containing protein 1-like [Thunnus albacares]|uniref:cysteine-rich and transmembrane domain-containing protein 1-like n=1 Tax=Thunnus albacares TaxID=8236 RepID=UPI001CF6DE11|nr:cysteine-rich and transmembrane domain-containing protein 1-like [Thunnus albacares]
MLGGVTLTSSCPRASAASCLLAHNRSSHQSVAPAVDRSAERKKVDQEVFLSQILRPSVQMSSEQPPPYVPHPYGGPSAPNFPPAFSSPPGTFPGSPYQTYPAQTYSGGGEHAYYQGPPGPHGPCMSQPGHQSYQSGPYGPHGAHGAHGAHGPPGHWDGHSPCGEPPKQTVYLVERDRGDGDDGDCMSACATALCCCCLWDMLTHDLC